MKTKLLALATIALAGLFTARPSYANMHDNSWSHKQTTNHWTGKTMWSPIAGAHHYNIYFREKGSMTWNHGVAGLNKDTYMHHLMYLVPGQKYEYWVQGNREDGSEAGRTGITHVMK